MTNLAYLGMACALCLSALGSGIGTGIASQAAVGGWKKSFSEGRPASFIMVAFAGAPLTQTIYGFLLMNFIRSAFEETGNWLMALCVGIFGGAARLARVPPTTSSSSVSSRPSHSSHWSSACCC